MGRYLKRILNYFTTEKQKPSATELFYQLYFKEPFIQALDASPDAMIIINQAGHIIYATNETEKMFGYHKKEMIGQIIEILIPENYRTRHKDYRNYYFEAPSTRRLIELFAQRKNSEVFQVEISLSPLKTPEGITAIIAIRDITERKTAKELKLANKELEQFAYITSHDLKAPLRAIDNLATWIEEDSSEKLDKKSKEYFQLLKSRVQRMYVLIDGILQYSHSSHEKIPLSKVNVKTLLNDILLSLSIPKGLAIHITSMPTMFAPEILLNQVFSNLISNALTHHDSKKGTITITSKKLPNAYEFCVEDDGPGIPENCYERIFEIYQTLQSHDEAETAGIGLAIVKKTLEKVNGKIWVEPAKPKGSRFCFTWPIINKPELNE